MPMSINSKAPATPAATILPPGAGETHAAMGVTLTFKVVGADSGGQWLVMEYNAPPNLSGPPPHVHKVTTEIFYVLEGGLAITANGVTSELGPGGFAYVPPGTAHTFAKPHDAPAKYLLMASPAGLELYFAEMMDLLKAEPQWPPKDKGKFIALLAKYDTFPMEVAE